MFYNRNNPQWKFSKDQCLTDDDYYDMVGEYDELAKSMLSTDFRDINEKFYGIKENYQSEEQRERKRRKAMIGAVIGIIVFAALVILLIFKQLLIFGFAACGVFLLAGISVLITGKGEYVESTSKANINRVIAICMIVASVAILFLMLFRSRFVGAEFFVLLFVILFGIAGLGLLVISILLALSGKIIYTKEVSATCSGYVRFVSRDSGDNGRRFTFINTSPLFNYSVDGLDYEAVYDDFIVKRDSDISLGQTVLLRVDPRHPENILSPATTHKGAIIFQIVMALLFIGVAVGMAVYVAGGSAKDMTVETQWNPAINQLNGETENSRTPVTDEMIQELYVNKVDYIDEWYVETCIVASTRITADGEVLTFEDETFNEILYPECNAPKPGTELIVYYYIDETQVEYGKRYKRSFATGDPDKFEYVGTHGTYGN